MSDCFPPLTLVKTDACILPNDYKALSKIDTSEWFVSKEKIPIFLRLHTSNLKAK
jgi:hypothetical protein